MTLSVPSFLAAATSLSMPPMADALVAVAASLLEPEPEPPPPQAVSVSPAASTAMAGTRERRRKVSSRVGSRAAGPTAGCRGFWRSTVPGWGNRNPNVTCRPGERPPWSPAQVTTVPPLRSAPAEGRLARPVLEEGAHAGLLVLGVEQAGEQLGLQRQPAVDGQLEALVDRPLGGREGQRRTGRDLLRHGDGSAVHLVVRDDGVHHADLQRLLGADVPAGHHDVLGPRRADQPGQPLGAAGARDDAEQDLRLADLGAGAH